MRTRRIAAVCIALAASICTPAGAEAKSARPAGQVAAFKRHHPCPSTGARRGGCPGYVVDHVVPLCAGGADRPGNMQWQTIRDARAKDVQERRQCRALRHRL